MNPTDLPFKPPRFGNPPLLARIFGRRITASDIVGETITTIKSIYYRGTYYLVEITDGIYRKP